MNKLILIILIVLIGDSKYCAGQWVPMDTLHDYCWLCHNDQHLIGEPYNHSLKRELPLAITTGAIFTTGLIMNFTTKVKPFTQEQLNSLNKNNINAFDRGATSFWSPSAAQISDYALFGISLLPALFLSEHHTEKDFKSLSIMTAEAFAFNFGTTYIVKNIVRRSRPYVYNTTLPLSTRTDKESRLSYYSGHTSQTAAATFLFAKVISDYHPDLRRGIKAGIWTFAFTVPAVEAYFRVIGGKHYPTDVITGYLLGAFSGIIIPELHRDFRYTSHKKGKLDMGFLPINKGMLYTMSYSFK